MCFRGLSKILEKLIGHFKRKSFLSIYDTDANNSRMNFRQGEKLKTTMNYVKNQPVKWGLHCFISCWKDQLERFLDHLRKKNKQVICQSKQKIHENQNSKQLLAVSAKRGETYTCVSEPRLILIDFTSDWLRRWRETVKQIIKFCDTKPNQTRITFDTQVKFALFVTYLSLRVFCFC